MDGASAVRALAGSKLPFVKLEIIACDISKHNRLAETRSVVQEVRFELPVDIPGGGVCLVNRQAFANLDQDQEKSDSELFEEVLGALRLAICFDLFKTLVFPSSLADWTHAHVVLGKHRGQVQVIDRRVAELLQNLAYQDFKHCGITYIGRRSSEQYIESLSESCILSLIPVVFVVFERPSKANIARRIDAFCAFDDQVQNIESHRRAGVFAVQVDRRFRLSAKDDVLDFIGRRWNEAAVEPSR